MTGLATIEAEGGRIFSALNDVPWPGQAAVIVNVVHIGSSSLQPPYWLDGNQVDYISSQLKAQRAIGEPYLLKTNSDKSYIGAYTRGMGFVITPEEAKALISQDPRNLDVVQPYLNGQDLNSSPDQSPNRWVINFRNWSLAKAQTYAEPFKILEERVYPERMNTKENRKIYEKIWWQFWRPRAELYEAVAPLRRVLAIARISKTVAFTFVSKEWVCNEKVVIIVSEDANILALLQSSFHNCWAWQYSSTLKSDLNYAPSDCFENFPFPILHTLESIGETYHEHRRQLMLVRQEGLTATYNHFHNPSESAADLARLRALHVEMDHAVAAAYGWADLDLGHGFHATAQGLRYTISEAARREVLTRLLALNHARYAEEVAAGLHGKKGSAGANTKATKGKPATPAQDEDAGQLGLFE